MNEQDTDLEQGALDAEEAARLREASEADGDGGDDAGGSGDPGRPRRPGRLERRALAAEQRALEAEARAQAAQQAAYAYQSRLAEAHEAGNRIAADGLQVRLQQAEQQLQSAIEAGDSLAVVKANRAVADLAARAAQIPLHQPRRDPPPQQAPVQQPVQHTPTTASWLSANGWYGRDPELTGIAQAVHKRAVAQGIEVDSDEYWSAIERGVEAVAPGTVRSGRRGSDQDDAPVRPQARPAGGGAAVTQGAPRSPNAPRGEVRLSADEAEAARTCGMTPQEYKQWQTKLVQAGRLNGGAR